MSFSFGHFLAFIIQALFSLGAFLLLMRILLQASGVSYYNPLSQLCVQSTNWAIQPFLGLRKISTRLDCSVLLVLILWEALKFILLIAFSGFHFDWRVLLLSIAIDLIHVTINTYFYSLMVTAVMSWISPYSSPVVEALDRVNEPLLRPIRRILPPLGGFDLSTLVVMILLQAINAAIP